jgi:RNA polymerase sigma-70 factor (ECF subfamily)
MTFACDGAVPGVAIAEEAVHHPIGPGEVGRSMAPSSGGQLVNASASSEAGSEQLAQRAKEGSRDAFELLVTRHERQIFNYLYHLTRNRHDAEDLVQETFIKAYRGIHRYDASFAFATWLFTIAKRTAYSHFRSAERAEVPDNQVDRTNPATLLEEKDESDLLWALARRLKQNQYEALWLRYGEDFSVAEIARIMKTNQVRVKVLLHRARATLAKWLRARNVIGPTPPNDGRKGTWRKGRLL